MQSRILILSTLITVWVTVAVAQQRTEGDQVEAAAVKTQAADTVLVPAASHEQSQAPITEKNTSTFDADAAYKSNCARCHLAPRRFSERKTATIMRHMRVRANLTEEEAEGILKFLTQ